MFKRLTVKNVSGEQREFAERTANNPVCKAECLRNCHGEAFIEETNYALTELVSGLICI